VRSLPVVYGPLIPSYSLPVAESPRLLFLFFIPPQLGEAISFVLLLLEIVLISMLDPGLTGDNAF